MVRSLLMLISSSSRLSKFHLATAVDSEMHHLRKWHPHSWPSHHHPRIRVRNKVITITLRNEAERNLMQKASHPNIISTFPFLAR
jgi:hypothetical protein